MDALHRGAIDDDTIVANRLPCEAMTTAADDDQEVVATSKINRTDYILASAASHDHPRSAVERPVPDAQRHFIIGSAWTDQWPVRARLEFGDADSATARPVVEMTRRSFKE
jgi:hypothetical protein